MLSIGLYIFTTEITSSTPWTANLVQFFKFSAPYIQNGLEKVARFFFAVSKMAKSKDLKLWKYFADFCSLYEY